MISFIPNENLIFRSEKRLKVLYPQNCLNQQAVAAGRMCRHSANFKKQTAPLRITRD